MAVDQSQAMWQHFISNLAASTAGKGLDPKNFLPTSGLAVADWEYLNTSGLSDPNAPAPGTLNVINMEKYANLMPQWSPVYNPGNSFYDQYCAFLWAIALKGGDPAQQQIADNYAKQVQTAQKQLSADKMAAMTGWKAFNDAQASIPQANQTSYADWYNEIWAGTITGDESNYAAALQNYNRALQAVGGPDFKTIEAAQQAATLSSNAGNGISSVPGGPLLPAYTITTAGELNTWYLDALQRAGPSVPVQPDPQISFTIDLSDQQTSSQNTSNYLNVAGGGSYSEFFWGGSAAASYSQSSSSQAYSNLLQKTKLTYTAMMARVFGPIQPGPWFKSDIVSGFYDQISPNSALANKSLFGPNGFLNLRAGQLFIVYRPSVTLTADTDTIQSIVNAFQQQSSASISVGGFFWSAHASESQGQSSLSSDLKVSSDGTSATIIDNTNVPKVIGIIPVDMDPNAH